MKGMGDTDEGNDEGRKGILVMLICLNTENSICRWILLLQGRLKKSNTLRSMSNMDWK
jgi:hypothetical protein